METSGNRKLKIALLSITLLLAASTPTLAQLTTHIELETETIYQTEGTTLTVEVSNLQSAETKRDLAIQIHNEELSINRKFSMASLSPGERWTGEVEIKTREATPPGTYEIKGEVKYNSKHLTMAPTYLTIQEKPIKLEANLKERTTPRGQNNSITIQINNTGTQALEKVTINPRFDQIFYIETIEECKRTIEKLHPGESFTAHCAFKATEEASGQYTLKIETIFTESEREHRFNNYEEIRIKSELTLPQTETLVIGIIVLIIIFILMKKYI